MNEWISSLIKEIFFMWWQSKWDFYGTSKFMNHIYSLVIKRDNNKYYFCCTRMFAFLMMNHYRIRGNLNISSEPINIRYISGYSLLLQDWSLTNIVPSVELISHCDWAQRNSRNLPKTITIKFYVIFSQGFVNFQSNLVIKCRSTTAECVWVGFTLEIVLNSRKLLIFF